MFRVFYNCRWMEDLVAAMHCIYCLWFVKVFSLWNQCKNWCLDVLELMLWPPPCSHNDVTKIRSTPSYSPSLYLGFNGGRVGLVRISGSPHRYFAAPTSGEIGPNPVNIRHWQFWLKQIKSFNLLTKKVSKSEKYDVFCPPENKHLMSKLIWEKPPSHTVRAIQYSRLVSIDVTIMYYQLQSWIL